MLALLSGGQFKITFCIPLKHGTSQLLLKILRPSLMIKYLYFCHVSSKISKNPPFLTIGDPQKVMQTLVLYKKEIINRLYFLCVLKFSEKIGRNR
jgi:hypothetical protein